MMNSEERKLLRKQLQLLTEQSRLATERELPDLSVAMCEIYDRLEVTRPTLRFALCSAVLSNLVVCFLIPEFSVKWNAKGLILNSAQLFGRVGNTFLGGGEAGREALLPLDRNDGWKDEIADRLALRIGGGADQSITINLVLDGKAITSTVVRNINAQARATGRNPLSAWL